MVSHPPDSPLAPVVCEYGGLSLLGYVTVDIR